MFFSTNEIAQLAITFPWGHTAQVKIKAAKHGVAPDDIIQEGREIILEKAPVFDPAKGTLCQFVFGHLEKRMLRQLGAHTFAVSIDSDEHFGDSTRSIIANLEAPAVYDDDFPPPSDQSKSSKALSIASFVSGKSTTDLARALGWVFRSIVPTDSGPLCPAIPVHRAHPFRSIVPSLRARPESLVTIPESVGTIPEWPVTIPERCRTMPR